MEELKLYKLITESGYVDSFGWRETCFYVWVSYIWFDVFIEKITEIFDTGMFDDGGVEATLFADQLCIDLCELVGSYLDVKDVFPMDEYQS